MATVREAATAWLGTVVLLEEGMAGHGRECAISIRASLSSDTSQRRWASELLLRRVLAPSIG